MKNIERYAQEIYDLIDESNVLSTSLVCVYLEHNPIQKLDTSLAEDKKKIIKWLNSTYVYGEARLTYNEAQWLHNNLAGKEVKYIIKTPINLFVISEYNYEVYNLKKIGLNFCGLDVNQQFTLDELGVR